MQSKVVLTKCGYYLGAKDVFIEGSKPYYLNYFHIKFDDEINPTKFRAFPEYSEKYFWKKLMSEKNFRACFTIAQHSSVDDSQVIVDIIFK